MHFISPGDGHRLDKAITYLVESYKRTGSNPKPVIFHSLNVAFYLLDLGYSISIAEVAILHDLIEDSETTREDIARVFGAETAAWVDALSFKTTIEDKEARYREMFDRVKAAGREPLIIKCADIEANSFYIRLVEDPVKQKFLLEKLDYFLEISCEAIGNEPVWAALNQRSAEEKARLSALQL